MCPKQPNISSLLSVLLISSGSAHVRLAVQPRGARQDFPFFDSALHTNPLIAVFAHGLSLADVNVAVANDELMMQQ